MASEIQKRIQIVQQKIVALEPLTENSSNLRIYGNCVLFQNKGATTATIDNGLTIAPGEARAFNTDSPYILIAQNVSVRFSGAGANRLEIVLIVTANIPEIDNYIQNISIR